MHTDPQRALSRRGFLRFAFPLSLALAQLSARAAHAPELTEYQIKAAYLFNFALFVQWPSDSFESASAPFIIGILGEDPFGGALEATLGSQEVHGRSLQVKRFSQISELSPCHILFLRTSDQKELDEIRLGLRHVLTVGESDGFCEHGGCIRFVRQGKRVKLEINPLAARAAELKLSSELLSVARLIDGETQP